MTVTATSLTSAASPYGDYQTSYDTDSVSAPANSLLAVWVANVQTPSVSGLGLTWVQQAIVYPQDGYLALFTAEVGSSSVEGAITVGLSFATTAVWDVDCVSGDDGEVLQFGTNAIGVVTSSSGGAGSNASLTFPTSVPTLYLFASSVGSDGSASASPGEDPAWTQLAFVGSDYASFLETQVSPDASNPTAQANWSGDAYGWGAVGIPVSVV